MEISVGLPITPSRGFRQRARRTFGKSKHNSEIGAGSRDITNGNSSLTLELITQHCGGPGAWTAKDRYRRRRSTNCEQRNTRTSFPTRLYKGRSTPGKPMAEPCGSRTVLILTWNLILTRAKRSRRIPVNLMKRRTSTRYFMAPKTKDTFTRAPLDNPRQSLGEEKE